MNEQSTVFIVDDDPEIRKILSVSLELYGYKVHSFESALDFLKSTTGTEPGCLVLDICMPGMTGIELQAALIEKGRSIPIIFMTSQGDIPTSVHAMKEGAFDFLEKSCEPKMLLDRVKLAFEKDREFRRQATEKEEINAKYGQLTPREKQVMKIMVAGAANSTNKEIARILDISNRTVDEHRAKIMQKMEAKSLTDLVDKTRLLGICKG